MVCVNRGVNPPSSHWDTGRTSAQRRGMGSGVGKTEGRTVGETLGKTVPSAVGSGNRLGKALASTKTEYPAEAAGYSV